LLVNGQTPKARRSAKNRPKSALAFAAEAPIFSVGETDAAFDDWMMRKMTGHREVRTEPDLSPAESRSGKPRPSRTAEDDAPLLSNGALCAEKRNDRRAERNRDEKPPSHNAHKDWKRRRMRIASRETVAPCRRRSKSRAGRDIRTDRLKETP
jgi:hypothetical protein